LSTGRKLLVSKNGLQQNISSALKESKAVGGTEEISKKRRDKAEMPRRESLMTMKDVEFLLRG